VIVLSDHGGPEVLEAPRPAWHAWASPRATRPWTTVRRSSISVLGATYRAVSVQAEGGRPPTDARSVAGSSADRTGHRQGL